MFSTARFTATRMAGPASVVLATAAATTASVYLICQPENASAKEQVELATTTTTIVTTNNTAPLSSASFLLSTKQDNEPKKVSILALSPSNTNVIATSTTATAGVVDLQKIREAIVSLIESDLEKRNDGTSLYGTMIRLAWHASGTYSQVDNSGGSNGGRMRFNPEASWGANAGLDLARNVLEPIKKKFPGISYADLYTYAGVVAVEEAGGPKIPYSTGRVDMESGETSPPDGRLPDADKGSKLSTVQHIRDIFYRMGFTDQEIVALLGAHSMGRCHTDRSGYWGPWSTSENTFSNEYFRLLVEERWSPKLTHNGAPWTGPDQYEDKTGQLMMLPSDIFLLVDPSFKEWVVKYAADEELFFKHFAAAFGKLLALGCPVPAPKKPFWKFW